MSAMLLDTHTHYSHKRFDSGREEILREIVDNNVMTSQNVAIYKLNAQGNPIKS